MNLKAKNTHPSSFLYIVFALAIPILVSRILFLNVAAGNDESMYYILGEETLKGNVPYSTFYEMKPPLLFFNYAIVALFFSKSVLGLHLAGLFVSILNTILFYYLICKILDRDKGLISALVFFTLISSPQLCGLYLLSEHFVLIFVFLSLIWIVKSNSEQNKNLFISGFFLGIGVLTKQSAIFFIPLHLYLLSEYYQPFTYLKKISVLVAGGLSILLVTLFYLFATDSATDAYYWILKHSQAYTTKNTISDSFEPFKFFLSVFVTNHIVFLILAGIGFSISAINKLKKEVIIGLLLFCIGIIALLPGLRFYSQYWILLVPSLALMSSYILNLEYKLKQIKYIIPLACLIHFGLNYRDFFPKDKDAFISSTFGGQNFKELKLLSEKLEKIMKKDETFLALGGIPQTYLYTNKSPITHHVWTPMISFKNKECEKYRTEFKTSFETNPPDYVFFSYNPYHWSFTKDASQEIYNYVFRQVNNNYQKIMAIDLIAPKEIVAGNEIFNFTEKENSMVVYKRK